jgi:hypothetical protein
MFKFENANEYTKTKSYTFVVIWLRHQAPDSLNFIEVSKKIE